MEFLHLNLLLRTTSLVFDQWRITSYKWCTLSQLLNLKRTKVEFKLTFFSCNQSGPPSLKCHHAPCPNNVVAEFGCASHIKTLSAKGLLTSEELLSSHTACRPKTCMYVRSFGGFCIVVINNPEQRLKWQQQIQPCENHWDPIIIIT